MSQQKPRFRSLYLLMALNLVLLALTVYNIHSYRTLEQRGYEGCVRGNGLREVARHALLRLGDAESLRLAKRPEVQRQPCETIYPGGAR